MFIEETLKNVRCDSVGCHKIAKYNLCTNSYKGKIILCEECFNSLFFAMQKIKKQQQLTKQKSKGEN